MEELLTTCDICGEEYNEDCEGMYFEEQHLCESCIDTETTVCRRCDNRIWNDDVCGDGYCQSCFDEYYTTCSECGDTIHYDETYYTEDDRYRDNPFCCRCYDKLDKIINGYYYKPEPIFFGSGIFYGVELEVDDGGENADNAKEILNKANSDYEHVYIKHDGSLDDGFEIVTHPMSFEYHMTQMPWKAVLEKAISLGYLSHQSGTCGLHVHISRIALGETNEIQEEVIGRILYFVEKFWNEMLKFSRRNESQINRWAARYGLKNSPSQTLKDAKDKRLGRYVCVNLENYHTVELRIFRGTLKHETLIATLQMVDEICNVAISMSDDKFQSMTWSDFVQGIKGKEELKEYLKIKHLEGK